MEISEMSQQLQNRWPRNLVHISRGIYVDSIGNPF